MNRFNSPVRGVRAIPVRGGQSGVVLAVTMIVLVILLISSVALVRSFGTSVQLAGNLATRRDMTNQGEQAVTYVFNSVLKGTAGTLTQQARLSNNAGLNYSACQLPVDVHGVPTILTDDTNFTTTTDLTAEPWADANCYNSAVGSTANDLASPTGDDVTIRYVIDRQCTATTGSVIAACVTTPVASQNYGSYGDPVITPPGIPVYRISIRVTDARNARTFLQTTFSN